MIRLPHMDISVLYGNGLIILAKKYWLVYKKHDNEF